MNFSLFNKQWSSEIHTKWDNSWYDNAYFGPDGVEIKSDRIDLCIKEIPRILGLYKMCRKAIWLFYTKLASFRRRSKGRTQVSL